MEDYVIKTHFIVICLTSKVMYFYYPHNSCDKLHGYLDIVASNSINDKVK